MVRPFFALYPLHRVANILTKVRPVLGASLISLSGRASPSPIITRAGRVINPGFPVPD